ncbi:energy-coupling factor ABC transporter ATP-binding protein [Caenispirillum salinarum]|uniref:energy-coupling factor ABC transporter ATP-binding protein n=1 Tax=Caenispirillum salinarum TaxID=859058 RepID=UPI0038503656
MTATEDHTAEDAVVLEDVRLRRGGRMALDGVSLRLTEPRVAVVGRNGSGKSTLARLVKGLLRPDSGTVRVFGRDPARRDRRAIADVGFLFQNSDHQILCPTVAEEIAFGPVELGTPRVQADAAARSILDDHGIAVWAERPVAALSEGQRRLVCLLAVLVSKPRLLVLDEPYAGLDIPTRLRLQRFIARLPQRVLLISHEPESLDGFDRALWLEDGRLAADGAPAEVLPAFTRAMHALVPGDDDLATDGEGAAWVA